MMLRTWRLLPCLLALAGAGPASAAKPVFENGTPVGFSPADSSTRQDFVAGQTVSVRVDLDQAATSRYPVVGHFHALEKSVQLGTTDTDGMQVDVAMARVAPFGVTGSVPAPGDTTPATHPALHMAWIEERGTSAGRVYNGGITPVYQVMYCRSFDGGATFSTPVSVSGQITYHPLTANGAGGSFSTLDLEVDSGGRPRLAYAFVSTADHRRRKNVYLAYSQDGGGTWQTPLLVNDALTVGADLNGRRNCAFPRLAIDDRDNLFVAYVRGATTGGGTDDVLLASVDRFSLPFTVLPVGETGAAGTGGVRLAPDGDRHTGPDLAVGDGDALHVVYFNDTDDRVEHRRLRADDTWSVAGAAGWNQNADGASVGSFDDEAATNPALDADVRWHFPCVVVDRQRTPDRAYAVYKRADATPSEGIYLNQYDDSGTLGTGASWGTASSIWSAALFGDGAGRHNVELDWRLAERVAAVADTRLDDRGDLHIAFTAGYSGGGEHDVYYALYNGVSWTLPEKVADDDSDGAGTTDGIAATDVFLLGPALARHPDSDHLFLGFAAGTGEGFGLGGVTNVNHHAYFKVLGRDLSWEDRSVPRGAYQYTLQHTPVNPHDAGAEVADNPVYVHVAEPLTGRGLGARADSSDGFLSGDWESVGTRLTDNDKYFEGRENEDPASTREWGDDDDKVGLLVKLNVLGSDSSTNLQLVTSSTASAGGTGVGARSVRVAVAAGSFAPVGSFFALGADIDVVATDAAPGVSIAQPDGSGDQADTEYAIQYTLQDADDDLGSGLEAGLYAYPSPYLRTVQDIRTYATLIVDENDRTSVNAAGTDDFLEGANQVYTWDDPPDALESAALLASILRLPSGPYWVYLVADDGSNPPAFAVSAGPLTLRHGPLVRQVDPIAADTVDTGVRSGTQANPYDLDFRVVDYDSQARVQLFYAAAAGITSVSVSGTYPNLAFALGKSLSGTRGAPITPAASLTGRDTELSWDVTSPLVPQGAYYLYAVASDSVSIGVGYSSQPLVVRHSPSFVFYEPGRDTQRRVDSGSQPVYAIQWQKGPGDQDLDHDAGIGLYFTTDDPAVTDHATDAGAAPTSLLADPDTRTVVTGLGEDGDGEDDIYVWDLRDPPADVPQSGQRVWLYAVVTDGGGNTTVARGGSLVIDHTPSILLTTPLPEISQGDQVRLEWEDYLVDDGVGTDDAYVRLYAAHGAGLTTLQGLEAAVAAGSAYLVNSSDGTAQGAVTSLRESSDSAYHWDTRTSTFSLPEGEYYVYAGISADATFADNPAGRVSCAPDPLRVGASGGIDPHLALTPSRLRAAGGDTLTFEVLVQSDGQAAESVTVALDLGTGPFTPLSPGSPFTDLGEVFATGTVVDNSTTGSVIRYSKTRVGGEIVGSPLEPARLARCRVVAPSGFSGSRQIVFQAEQTGLGISGSAEPLRRGGGLTVLNAQVQSVSRGRILATVLLEGRSAPLGSGNQSTLLDVHLRLPGSTVDVTESRFQSANDDYPATASTVEVQTTSAGGLVLSSIPAGRYVLAVKDSSHLAGRTDTLTVRHGETLVLGSTQGFFATDVRGDPSFLLERDGRLLKAGDATGDNEVDEDDVNAIDAAWGTDPGVSGFARADLNNDGRVGVEDLTVTSSNISSSTGFGAPPVYKPVAEPAAGARGSDTHRADGPVVVLEVPDYAGGWQAGDEVEVVLRVQGAADLAGFALDLACDPAEAEILPGVQVGALFAANPAGYCRRAEVGRGALQVAAARRGREWSAQGEGEVLRLRLGLARDGFPASLRLEGGRFLDAAYRATPARWHRDPAEAALPRQLCLLPNYPNPFNPATVIPFTVPRAEGGSLPVTAAVYDLLGQRLRLLLDGPVAPGRHRLSWDGRDGAGRPVASGVYLCRLQAGATVQVRKMTLVR
ncbi:MAG: hypothetical protein AB1505_03760 [Candidatus Latescibacterota bacterium]